MHQLTRIRWHCRRRCRRLEIRIRRISSCRRRCIAKGKRIGIGIDVSIGEKIDICQRIISFRRRQFIARTMSFRVRHRGERVRTKTFAKIYDRRGRLEKNLFIFTRMKRYDIFIVLVSERNDWTLILKEERTEQTKEQKVCVFSFSDH